MRLHLFTSGESHGPALVALLEGIPAGLPLTPEIINHELARRQRGYGSGGRMKIEQDRAGILGGVMAGETTGAPIALLIPNMDHRHWKGKPIPPFTTPRPGHADLSGAVKFGYRDLRPALERASARETAARVAAGAICKHFLAQFGIRIGGYVLAIGEHSASLDGIDYEARFSRAEESDVRCPDPQAAERMHQAIAETMRRKDTLGGILEIVALNVPPGLGSFTHWEGRLDARLAMAMMSVPAIKGVEIGDAFANARRPGTQAHDPIRLDAARGSLYRPTNRAGGVEGGISNGEPIVLRVAMKPIATTLTPQATVDLATGQETQTRYERSDFCPVPRAVPILEAMLAFTLADALLEKVGGDSMAEIRPRVQSLRHTCLDDLPMANIPQVFWEEPL